MAGAAQTIGWVLTIDDTDLNSKLSAIKTNIMGIQESLSESVGSELKPAVGVLEEIKDIAEFITVQLDRLLDPETWVTMLKSSDALKSNIQEMMETARETLTQASDMEVMTPDWMEQLGAMTIGGLPMLGMKKEFFDPLGWSMGAFDKSAKASKSFRQNLREMQYDIRIVKDAFLTINAAVGNVFGFIYDWAKFGVKIIATPLIWAAKFLWGTVSKVVKFIGGVFFAGVKAVFKIIGKIGGLVGDMVKAVFTPVTMLIDAVRDLVKGIFEPLKGIFDDIVNVLKMTLMPFFMVLRLTLLPFIWIMMPFIMQWVATVLIKVIEWVRDLIPSVIEGVKFVVDTITRWWKGGLPVIWADVKRWAIQAWDMFSGWWDKTFVPWYQNEWSKDIFPTIRGYFITDFWGPLTHWWDATAYPWILEQWEAIKKWWTSGFTLTQRLIILKYDFLAWWNKPSGGKEIVSKIWKMFTDNVSTPFSEWWKTDGKPGLERWWEQDAKPLITDFIKWAAKQLWDITVDLAPDAIWWALKKSFELSPAGLALGAASELGTEAGTSFVRFSDKKALEAAEGPQISDAELDLLRKGYAEAVSSGRIPHRRQHGGIVTSPELSMVGEAGPEAIIPIGPGMAGVVAALVDHLQMSRKSLPVSVQPSQAGGNQDKMHGLLSEIRDFLQTISDNTEKGDWLNDSDFNAQSNRTAWES